jgi:hypothetical protein
MVVANIIDSGCEPMPVVSIIVGDCKPRPLVRIWWLRASASSKYVAGE